METEKTKKMLENALKKALQQALIEMESVGDGFSEESLRYIVMSEISRLKIWGTFPNKPNCENKLLFEQEYNKLKFRKKTLKPDIVSKNNNEHHLAIELKIKSDVSDINKCKEYINEKKGRANFKLAASVYAIPKKLTQIAYHIESKIKHANKIGISRKNGRLLVAYIEWHSDYKYLDLKNNFKRRIRLEWIY
jgi:hypothetical protein